ncbi:MAG: helix-hairpin-helix domain-containing protein [Candidatus Neomarinimicrobiota bacterium]
MNRYKYFGLFILLMMALASFAGAAEAEQKIDLNTASEAVLAQLPLSQQQLNDILNWREYNGPFESIFDLRKIQSIDYETFLKLKELTQLSPVFLEASQQRVEDNYYKVEQWISDDGASENSVNTWIDMLSNPVNINSLGYFDLLNLAGLSPVDAVAVIKRQKQGAIKNRTDLRSTDDLSYYGFSNLEDFIRYSDDDLVNSFGGSFSTVIKNITLSQTPSDDADSYSDFVSLDHPLDAYYKLRLHWGTQYHLEGSYLRNMGEPTIYYDNSKIPEFKAFFEMNNLSAGLLKVNKIVFGDYVASFGQGVTFEATDFFLPRKTGFGFRNRLNGLSGNTSRVTQYGLRGVGVEAQIGNLIGTGFFSLNKRDAIVNADGSFSNLITMYPRLNHGLYDSISTSLINSVNEMVLGGNVKYSFMPGTYIGFTLYQSMYDRALDLQVTESLLDPTGYSKYLTQIGNSADTEIDASYESSNSSALWSQAKAVRRIYGVEFSTVIRNLTLQGEFAELDRNLEPGNRSGDPSALVLSGYLQFDNLNFLLLYRNYELGFDNPYQRSFSNYQRFKGTIYEDTYYLKDPILGYLYSATAQPQSEHGLYLSTRYQLHRSLVVTAEQDIWTRVADNAQYNRAVVNLEYRPVFKYRFRIRQKWQHRDKTDILTPVFYQANETRLEAIVRMSKYNQVKLFYSNSFTEFTPRSRLVINAETGSTSYVGNAGAASDALGMTVTHNVNERIKLMGSLMTYSGFFWNFEDTDFRIFNTDTRALHGWVAVFSRLSRDLSVRFKYSFDLHDPLTNVVNGIIYTKTESNPVVSEVYYDKFYSDFRIQLDYRF